MVKTNTLQKHFYFSVIGIEIFKIFCSFSDCYFLAFDVALKFSDNLKIRSVV